MKNLAFFLALLFASVPALACDDVDGYAGQFAVQKALGRPLFGFEGMTPKQIGDAHWFDRKRMISWAWSIPDACVRAEALGYIESDMDFAGRADKELKEHRPRKDTRLLQEAARNKLRTMRLPEPPR